MDPREIYLQGSDGKGVRLRIPAAYMQWADQRRGGAIGHSVTFVAVYPSMAPIAASPPTQFSISPLQFDSIMEVEAIPQESIARQFADAVNASTQVDEVSVPGYRLHRAPFAGQIDEYLVPLDPDDRTAATVLNCGPYVDQELTRKVWGICRAYVPMGGRLLISYTVPRRAVDQLEAVEKATLDLIGTFLVDCFEGPELLPDDRPAQFYLCAM